MTPEQIALVQATWKRVVPIAATAADLFYERLFTLDPSVRALFPDDLTEQKKKLLATLGVVVDNLRDLGAVLPRVQKLGRDHATYGVRAEHYDTVGAALLWTLEAGLGDAYTAEVAAAWAAAYGIVAEAMQSAARVTTS